MNAKAGDKVTDKARQALARAMNAPLAAVPTEVLAKTETKAGQWVCIDCGALPYNNFEASSHELEKKKHRLAWRSAATAELEEP